jgi:hypothetical protein
MAIEYRFRFSEEFLLTSLARYRKQLGWYGWFRSLKVVAGLLIAILAAGAFYADALTIGAVLVAFMVLLFAAPTIDAWIIRRRFRKSPFYDDDIVSRLTDQGLEVSGRDSEVRIGWPIYTKCRRFADGLLLFQGPHLFNWLPNDATDRASIPEAERLAKEHVSDYRDV